ncbi:glucan endo-1,3-beta-glucosidase 13-like [Papaver somniferum]|uniref:glucan endo-1,3-beta-glucosidase 13-like n=1 Tax=Papaver somniferum TaxID=3469 RepID=UPI000E6FF87C|nr:glucan endo-1,3-beta-glucosidase 13-like [Papaver somniferum]
MERRSQDLRSTGTLLLPIMFMVQVVHLLVSTTEAADYAIPVTSFSPPEGNTTFLDGTTWCIAKPGVSQVDLQIALDWACGLGSTDCRPIRSDGPCFKPDTLLSHASYAFNSYYQVNGNNDVACTFGGTATLTRNNPSYGKCIYASSRPDSSSPSLSHNTTFLWLQILCLILLVVRNWN